MTQPIDPKYAAMYQQAEAHKGEQKGLLSPNTDLPARRLQLIALMIIGRMGEYPSDVLDVGCGYGDLSIHFPRPLADYHGIDAIRWIADEGRSKYPEARIECRTMGDLIRDEQNVYDVAVAVGVVSTLPEGGLKGFAAELRQLAGCYIALAYYPAPEYDGMFRSYTDEEIEEAFGCPLSECIAAQVPGDKHRLLLIPSKPL